MPFVITGEIPFYINALFEIVSGFTTTGSSILSDPTQMPYCINIWRCFSHWIGGMGVLVFAMAVLPMTDGRAMQFIDFTIISSSYFVFHSVETIIYGIVFTLVVSFMLDFVVNGSKQTVQLLIISKEYQEIANNVSGGMHRGVTVVEGKGWYTKNDVKLLIILAHKYELQDLMIIIKQTDPNAMVSQTFCHGVFGAGFEKIK